MSGLSLSDVLGVIERWLYLPDPDFPVAVLGAVAANRLPGDPVWLVAVGPPGSGKTEILQSVSGLDDVHQVATLTEAALLSGTRKAETDAASTGGPLRTIGESGIVLCKDFGSVLSMQRDARASVLAALREVYDGSWTSARGNGRREDAALERSRRLPRRLHPNDRPAPRVMGSMGERFALYRIASRG
jgi:hypothetical protein